MFKANYETIKKESIHVLNKFTYFAPDAKKLIDNVPFNNLPGVLNYYLEYKLSSKSTEKIERWGKIKNELYLIFKKNNPEKIMQLLHNIEVKRTVGRSYKTPLAETINTPGSFPDCFTILKNLKNSATQSDVACNFWRLWLAKETTQLNKYGAHSLSAYKIKEKTNDDGEKYLEIPTKYYKKIAEKTYETTEQTMLVKEKDAVRQQMHILESINYYRQDIFETIEQIHSALNPLFNKKDSTKTYYLLKKEQNILILEVLLYFQKKLDRRKTTDQREALNKIQELVDFVFNNIYQQRIDIKDVQTTRYLLKTIVKRLQQRVNTLDRQYPRLVKKRSILARELSKQAFALANSPSATATDVLLAAELMAAIASGYTNEETLQPEQLNFAHNLYKIENRLLILASLIEHNKEKDKEFERLITVIKNKIIDLIQKLKK